MKITSWNKLIALIEGKKREVSIAQIAEQSRITNALTDGEHYRIIKKLPEPDFSKPYGGHQIAKRMRRT